MVIITAAAAAAASTMLEKVYEATSRLIIVQPERVGDLGGIQAAQITARSYSEIMRSPNVARLVNARLRASGGSLAGPVEIKPVPETELISITAQAPTAASAKRVADVYADVVLDYAQARLEPTTGAKLSLADPAPLQAEPVRPQPKLYILLAILIGLPVGLAAAVVRERLDARVLSAHEIEEVFDVPVLGRIPRSGRTASDEVAFKEAFRLLRVSLGHVLGADGRGAVAVTSATSGEGKSTVTVTLALAAAEAGQRVIVVDGDVRRGIQMRLLQADAGPDSPGLVDAMLRRSSLDEVLYPTLNRGIRLLPSGRATFALSSALDSVQAQALMAALTERADLVLIDCPPLSAGADASVLAASAGAVILVTRLQVTSRPEIAQALHQLERVDARVIGCVVNADPLRAEPYGLPA